MFQEFGRTAPMRQSALKTMHASMAKADVFKSPENLSSALLIGLTDAYGEEIDDAGLAKYLEELTAVLIKRESNYETALQVHARWTQLRRTNESEVDKHVQLVDEYVFSLCYLGLGQHGKAESHCRKALELAEETRSDKTRLACLHIAGMLELRKGQFSAAIHHVCRAGLLAYGEESNAGYEKKGSIMRLIFSIGCFAMGVLEDEEVVPKSMQPILIAVQAQLQYPAQLTDDDQVRERKTPTQIIRELSATAAAVLGPVKTYATLALIGSSPTKFFKGDSLNDIAWVELEEQLFANVTDSPRLESSLAQFGPTARNPEQTETERQLNGILADSTAPTQRTQSSEIKDATEVENSVLAGSSQNLTTESWFPAIQYILKLYSSVRDADQRTILWHLSGGQQCDLRAFAAFGIQPELLPAELLTADSTLQLVKFLLELGADHASFDKDGRTPFMRAVETGNFDIADVCLSYGADPDSRSFTDETALHEAIRLQKPRAVAYCISQGCSLAARNLDGQTALAMAVRCDSTEICTHLLRAGANPLARDYIGRACLRLALEYKQYENFKACLRTLHNMPTKLLMGVLLDYGYTNMNLNEIIIQAQEFDLEILDIVKRYSGIPEDLTRRDRAGVTSYHRAAWNFTPEQVYNIFVQSGADWTIQEDCYGLSVLHLAAANSDPLGMLRVLMNDGGAIDNVEDRILNKKAIEMVTWAGLTMEFRAHESDWEHKIRFEPKKALSKKYFISWAKQCRRRYVLPLSDAEVEQLVEFRRTIAFAPLEVIGGVNSRTAAFQSAAVDLVYGSQAAENPHSTTTFASRAADRLHKAHQIFATGAIDDDMSDDTIEMRCSIPWRHNPCRWPHVYYMDRGGKCQFTRPLTEREEPVFRVWVIDEYGLVKGVLGAVSF
jgi:ankyrin repeat protein